MLDLLVGGVEARPAARVLLVLGPRPVTVARLRSRFPGAGLLALVEGDAPMALVVEVLEAGADTCVRSSDPRLLSAHLGALASWTARARTLVSSGGGGCR